jgi:hypothetical protein
VMRRSFTLASVFVMFLLVVSLPALANPVDQFKNASLIGVSGGGNVSGAFSFNKNTQQFSNIAISFKSSVFGNVNANDPNSIKGTYTNGQWWFQWSTWKNGDKISYKIIYNLATNQFTASGWISDRQGDKGTFNMSVPEGGTPLSYLMLSGFAVLAGILISGKQRHVRRTVGSS